VTIEDFLEQVESDEEDDEGPFKDEQEDWWCETGSGHAPVALATGGSRYGEALPDKSLHPQDAKRGAAARNTIGVEQPGFTRCYDNKAPQGTSTLGSREGIKNSEVPAMRLYEEVAEHLKTHPFDAASFQRGHAAYNHTVSQPRYHDQTGRGRSPGVYREMTEDEQRDYGRLLSVDYFWAQRFRLTCVFDEFQTVLSSAACSPIPVASRLVLTVSRAVYLY
jgi:hypothetical protein